MTYIRNTLKKEFLIEQYIILQKSAPMITREYHIPQHQVYQALERYGINCRTISESHECMPDNVKKVRSSKISKSRIGKGHLHTDDSKQKISDWNKGKIVSEVTKEKQRIVWFNRRNGAGTVTVSCNVCGEKFEVYASRYKSNPKCCSKECDRLYRKQKVGPKSPKWDHVVKKCIICGKIYNITRSRQYANKCCSMKCAGIYKSRTCRGPKSANWRGGTSYEPYCHKFNEPFKEHIRNKFNRVCYICDKTEEENGQRLTVHHVDYDKVDICNGKSWPFIAVCCSHNSRFNGKRWYWFNLLIHYWLLNDEIHFMKIDLFITI